MKDYWWQHYSKYFGKRNLNLGCGASPVSNTDWYNHDITDRIEVDLYGDLNEGQLIWSDKYIRDGARPPFAPARFDCILASHCLEHIDRQNIMRAVAMLYDHLNPGGHLISITPYGSSDDAWDNPHHRQFFTQNTYVYFTRALYEQPGHSGYRAHEGEPIRDWAIVETTFTPYPEYKDLSEPDLERAMRTYRNVIQEVQVVMQRQI